MPLDLVCEGKTFLALQARRHFDLKENRIVSVPIGAKCRRDTDEPSRQSLGRFIDRRFELRLFGKCLGDYTIRLSPT
jgi:hypothetical protein